MHQSYDPDISYLSEQIEALSRQVLTLQNQVQSLTIQNTELNRRIEDKLNLDEKNLGTQFLLTDFNEIGQFWRHTDSRIEDAIKLYLTINTIAVSGGVVLVSQTQNPNIVLGLLSAVSFVLYWSGIFLTGRMIGVWIGKTKYSLALNKIRSYFAENSPQILAYLELPLVNIHEDTKRAIKPLKKYKNPLVLFIKIWSSLLLSFCIASTSFILFPGLPSFALGVSGFMTLSLSMIFLRYWEINRINIGMASFENLRA